MSRIIVGLTGAFGSGTSFLATEFFEKSDFIKCSLSDILRSEYEKKYGKKLKPEMICKNMVMNYEKMILAY